MTPCMGGFCLQRDRCGHYVAPRDRAYPAERLCPRGVDLPVPMRRLPVGPPMVRDSELPPALRGDALEVF